MHVNTLQSPIAFFNSLWGSPLFLCSIANVGMGNNARVVSFETLSFLQYVTAKQNTIQQKPLYGVSSCWY